MPSQDMTGQKQELQGHLQMWDAPLFTRMIQSFFPRFSVTLQTSTEFLLYLLRQYPRKAGSFLFSGTTGIRFIKDPRSWEKFPGIRIHWQFQEHTGKRQFRQ